MEIIENFPPRIVRIRAGCAIVQAFTSLIYAFDQHAINLSGPQGTHIISSTGIPIIEDQDLWPNHVEADFSDGTTKTILMR